MDSWLHWLLILLLSSLKDALFLKQLNFVTIFWLIMQGDFLVHFMDIAREELLKKPDEISVEKLQVFFTLHKYSVVV